MINRHQSALCAGDVVEYALNDVRLETQVSPKERGIGVESSLVAEADTPHPAIAKAIAIVDEN